MRRTELHPSYESATSEGQPPEDLLVEGCTKRFRGTGQDLVTAVDNLTLRVSGGGMVAIIGSNGAGKSTLLSLIAGTTFPDSGRIVVSDRDISRMPSWQRVNLVSRVRQNPEHNMLSALTIEDNIALVLARGRGRFRLRRAGGRQVRELAREALAPLGMGLEDRLHARTGTLSGGQRQAMAVAMSSLGSPAVLLLDEHVAALDPNSAKRVTELTERLIRERGITTLMVTHDMAYALRHADRLLLMHAGRVVLDIQRDVMESLTVEDLHHQFSELAGEVLPDSTLLAANEAVPQGTPAERAGGS